MSEQKNNTGKQRKTQIEFNCTFSMNMLEVICQKCGATDGLYVECFT